MDGVNTIERVRLMCGFPRTQMLTILEVQTARFSIFTMQDDRIDPLIRTRAEAIGKLYEEWRGRMLRELSNLGDDESVISAVDASYILHVSPSHLSQLRKRGYLEGVPYHAKGNGVFSNTKRSYSVKALKDLLDYNSKAVPSGQMKTRGPLANSFLFWLKREHAAV